MEEKEVLQKADKIGRFKEFLEYAQSGEFVQLTENDIKQKVEAMLHFASEEERKIVTEFLNATKSYYEELAKHVEIQKLGKELEEKTKKFIDIMNKYLMEK